MRIDLQFEYFQQFRAQYYQAKARGEQLPRFKPPVPALQDGLRVCLGMRDTLFADVKFKQALARTFVNVGLKQTEANALCSAHFLQYTDAAKGALCTGKGKSTGKKKKGDNEREPASLGLFGSDFSLGGHLLDIMSRGESVSH